MRRPLTVILLLASFTPLFPQTGGTGTYAFLGINHSAFAAATGGITVSQGRDDLSLPYFNPSLLAPSMGDNLSLSFSTFAAGIKYGYAAYAKDAGERGCFGAGISFISYGSFTAADAAGNITGSFTAAEYAFNLMWSRQIDSTFTAGINIKPVFSHLERYFSAGLAADIGVRYNNPKLMLSAGLVIRNAGLQLVTYTGKREPLPLEITAGMTKQLAHAPLRFTLTLCHLEKPDLTHDYISGDDSDGGGFGENLLRHTVLGVEILPSRSFWAGAGFNYQRRAELKVDQRPGMAGFSVGFGFRTRTFDLAYGRDTFHLAGSSNHITLTLRTDFLHKKEQP